MCDGGVVTSNIMSELLVIMFMLCLGNGCKETKLDSVCSIFFFNSDVTMSVSISPLLEFAICHI